MGIVVPADVKLLHNQSLNIDETTLTGETVPGDKVEFDLNFSGPSAKHSEAQFKHAYLNIKL